ncbi:YigZ family protein [Neptuniibacter sp. QD57_21]|uniref:YigZ family protein n=1 Tax=Neptuniibacter sp. QD57_21 TaxID=3398213 RepID=UPI0039F57239
MTEFYPKQPYLSHEIEIKHSRFITHVAHTPDLESSRNFIAEIQQQHPKANHNCWAYIAGTRSYLQCWNSSDDGEPKGTAGKPMLNVLEHSDLCEITVVVTRYFGGIKLGAGGLVRAYSQAVQEALKVLPIEERIPLFPFDLYLPHHLVGDIELLLNQDQINILDRQWSEELHIQGEASAVALDQLKQQLTSLKHLTRYKDPETRW